MIVEYKELKSVIDRKHGFKQEYIVNLKKEVLRVAKEVSNNLVAKGFGDFIKIRVNDLLLNQVIIDTVEDLKRLKEFHPVKCANAIKEAAYLGYWWIKRKPIFVEGDIANLTVDGFSELELKKFKAKFLFINEAVVAYYLLPMVFDETKIKCYHCNTDKVNDEWKKAKANLIYFLAYRAESPKSIEGILTGMTLHPIWETNQDFWLGERHADGTT